jgi:hypothetical protein
MVAETMLHHAHYFDILTCVAIFSIAECERSESPLFSGAHCLCLWGTGDKVVSKEGHEHVLSLCSGVDSGESRLITYEGGFHNLLLGIRSPIQETVEHC